MGSEGHPYFGPRSYDPWWALRTIQTIEETLGSLKNLLEKYAALQFPFG